MKKLAILALLSLSLVVSGCGSRTLNTTPPNTTTSGNWEAHVNGGLGEASKLDFVTAFSVTDNGSSNNNVSLDITGFSFINTGACFDNGVNASSQKGLTTFSTTSGTDRVTGNLSYTVVSNQPSGNVLTLTSYQDGFTGTSTATQNTTGTLSNGVVVGTWTLSGPCTNGANPSPSGTFIMCQAAATCTAP